MIIEHVLIWYEYPDTYMALFYYEIGSLFIHKNDELIILWQKLTESQLSEIIRDVK
jgi:hypothetical protein